MSDNVKKKLSKTKNNIFQYRFKWKRGKYALPDYNSKIEHDARSTNNL